jgi:hypothetical protein
MSTTKTKSQNASATRNRKRILSVTVRRMIDDSPDSSYLGEYGNSPKSDYVIDRAHSEDCQSINPRNEEGLEWLDRIQSAICDNLPPDRELQVHGNFYLQEEMDTCDTLQECREAMECDCFFSGHWNNREYRYFNPNHDNYKGLPEEEIRKYCRQDFDRMESLNVGNWCYIGIRAEARVIVNEQIIGPVASHGIAQTITSGGLYGIESDSGKEHITETIQEELANLKTELLALGFSKRAISTAFKNVQEKGE